MALNQLLLLPLQVRLWGYDGTAQWYQIVAFAGLMTVADLGLRSAAHTETLQFSEGDHQSAEQYRANWFWIRALMFSAWLVLMITAATVRLPVWALLVVTAAAIDALIMVRISYFDTLRKYNEAEVAFLMTISLRLFLSATTLGMLGAHPGHVATINLGTALFGLFLQSKICRVLSVLGLVGHMPTSLKWDGLLNVRRTITLPLATWCQIQLPVLVLAQIATPPIVTMYVGIRAVFGLARATIQQISRVASVEYVAAVKASPPRATALMSAFFSLAGIVALGVSAAVLLDHRRLIQHWIHMPDGHMFSVIATSLGLALPFYAYQIAASVAVRSGRLDLISRNQLAFVALAAAAALFGLLSQAEEPYLYGLALAEVAVGLLFLRASSKGAALLDPAALQTWRRTAFVTTGGVLAASLVAQFGPARALAGEDLRALLWTVGLGGLILLPLVLFGYRDAVRLVAHTPERSDKGRA